MATRIYGVSKGEGFGAVTEDVGSATVADNFEFTVDFDAAVGITKTDALRAIDLIRAAIVADTWPPA